jgi:hypothetical protein
MGNQPERQADPKGMARWFSERDDGQRRARRVIGSLGGASFPGSLYLSRQLSVSSGGCGAVVMPIAWKMVDTAHLTA